MQDYKSPCAAATVCATLVNIQTHTHTQTAFDQLIWKAQPAELKLKTEHCQSLITWQFINSHLCYISVTTKKWDVNTVCKVNLEYIICQFYAVNKAMWIWDTMLPITYLRVKWEININKRTDDICHNDNRKLKCCMFVSLLQMKPSQ